MSTPTAPDWASRLSRLRDRWTTLGGDAVVISSPINLHYLTGLRASAGLLLQTRDDQAVLLDGRYTTVANERQADGQIVAIPVVEVESGYDKGMVDWLSTRSARRPVLEAEHVTVAQLDKWRAGLAVDWLAPGGLVEPLRLVKDPFELAVFRRAGQLLADVAGELGRWVRAGRTEREVALDIDRGLVDAGFERPAFETIVASGPNSAHPHARPGARRLAAGDLVVLDFGGVLDGYCVDLTRMASVGRVEARAGALYQAVQSAHAAALQAVRAGVPARGVDAAARQVLEYEGLGPAFVHSTGHGLGLEVHEAPRLSRLSPPEDVLCAGMVCTIEPGAYVPGLGGARLEDDVVVTEQGADMLTPASRDLLTV